MFFAITLRLDPVSAGRIEDLWRRLAESGIDSHCRDLGYGPHVTLGLYGDSAPVHVLASGLSAAARQWRTLPVRLGGIGVFPGAASILWAAPLVTADLLAFHVALRKALLDLPADPLYLPEAWMPDVSLSGPIAGPERALAALGASWREVRGVLDRADLVRFPPVDVLKSHELAT